MGTRYALLSALALALCVGAFAGCGGSKDKKILDTERVERAIEQSVFQKRHLRAQVSCPSGTEQKKGVTFRCTATYRGGSNPFDVTVDSDGGAVHYVGVNQ